VRENAEIELTDSYLTVPKFEFFYPELVSTVIAKSVALEKPKSTSAQSWTLWKP